MAVESDKTYTLFWEAMSGAMAVELVLEEMGVPYRRQPVDMAAGEHRSAAYLRLNPTGQVPALALPEGKVIGESAAIILTLGDRHPDSGLVPRGDLERPAFLRWLIYMAASPYMTFVQLNHPERFLDDPSTHDALIEGARQRLEGQFSALDAAIAGDPFFLPSGPTALDFYAYMLISFFPDHEGMLARNPRLRRLHEAVGARQSVREILPRHLG
ncbi:glutathione S-transferase family protein [Defluviimonas sp. WL0002]|uniref:Glutathione S-transferase family protein n=1 Tax=Albidovulum marisflavi TaxID=2984159 RepID=A0ABT2Z980_9RHOB|nr:glutathione S-transferase family protein [Defluviimonas sp. WL0002]MCV2867633.1 glutathione S-transferase family protein [Defluviimonas sp. WL0002]